MHLFLKRLGLDPGASLKRDSGWLLSKEPPEIFQEFL